MLFTDAEFNSLLNVVQVLVLAWLTQRSGKTASDVADVKKVLNGGGKEGR